MTELSLDHVAAASALSLTSSLAYPPAKDREAAKSFDDHLQRASHSEQPRNESTPGAACTEPPAREECAAVNASQDDPGSADAEASSEYESQPAAVQASDKPSEEEAAPDRPTEEQPEEESEPAEGNAEAMLVLTLPQPIQQPVAKTAKKDIDSATSTTAATAKAVPAQLVTKHEPAAAAATAALPNADPNTVEQPSISELPEVKAEPNEPKRRPAEATLKPTKTPEADQTQTVKPEASQREAENQDQGSERRPREKKAGGKQSGMTAAEGATVPQESRTGAPDLPKLAETEALPTDGASGEQSAAAVNEVQTKSPADQPAGAVGTSSGRAQTKLSAKLAGHDQQATGTGEVDRVRFVQRVARAFQAADEQGGQVRLRLSPPELGAMRLEVIVRDGIMTARMETETATARNLLLEHLPVLRDRLAEQNIKVDRFDVDVMGRQPGGSPDQSADNGNHRQRPATQTTRAAATTTVPAAEPTAPSGWRGNAQLNIIV